MPGNPNRYAEGMEYLEDHCNIGWMFPLTFTDSEAADYGGIKQLYFSGGTWDQSLLAGGLATTVSGWNGWENFPLEMTGQMGNVDPAVTSAGPPAERSGWGRYNWVPTARGIQALYTKFPSVTEFAGSDGGVRYNSEVKYGTNAPDLCKVFYIPKTGPYYYNSGSPNNLANRATLSGEDIGITSIAQIQILDLVSEGPIEGLVTGSYYYDFTNKKVGDIGYAGYSFVPFNTGAQQRTDIVDKMDYSNRQAPPEANSIFWDDVAVSSKGQLNFPYVDYKYTFGGPNNAHTVRDPRIDLYEDRYHLDGYLVDRYRFPVETSITRDISERLIGGNITGMDQVYAGNFLKKYYVYNTDLRAIKVKLKFNSLYETSVTGLQTAGETFRQNVYITFNLGRIFKDGSEDKAPNPKFHRTKQRYFSVDSQNYRGKITSPMLVTYTMLLRSYDDSYVYFPVLPQQIGWTISVSKRSADWNDQFLNNTVFVDSITEVYSERFTYPNCAMVYSKFDARYFNSIPKRSYKMRLLKVKVPSNYDPITKTYDGSWNGRFKLAWTDNPAWCFYDLVSNNRYGLGKYFKNNYLDKWNLYEIGQYCDQLVPDGLGGLEPRFTCNIHINTKAEAYKVLNDMASIFNGILYYSAGQILVAQDSEKDPVYLFNNSNVINGDFTYSDSSKKARRTVALVRYNDSKNYYKPAIEYVEDKEALLKFGIQEVEVTAFGCTSKTQARRLGKWFINSEKFETETINLSAGIEGAFLRPGDVIQVYDQNRRPNIYAGRTLELKSDSAILDLPYSNINLLYKASQGIFNVLTPTYSLERGTYLGDFYLTGNNSLTNSGISGANSSSFRRSQVQSINIANTNLFFSSGTGHFSNFVRVTGFTLNSTDYNLPQNTTWTFEINSGQYQGLYNKSFMNNPSETKYPGSGIEAILNQPKKYRIINVAEEENKTYSISALEYRQEKYDDIISGASLVSVATKREKPLAPQIGTQGIYRDISGYLGPTFGGPSNWNTPYSTNQGGTNSIGVHLIPPSNSGVVARYAFYARATQPFSTTNPPIDRDLWAYYLPTDIPPSGYFLTTQFLYYLMAAASRTGRYDEMNCRIPMMITPIYTGTYYFRVYAENIFGERSDPAEASFTMANQLAGLETLNAVFPTPNIAALDGLGYQDFVR